jgi:hypothetical protein
MSEEHDGEEPVERDEKPIEEELPEEITVEDEPIPEEERTPLSSLRDRLEARNAAEAEPHGAGESDEVDPDVPLSELAAEASASSEAERSELFEEVDVGEVDAEAVWDAVVEEGNPPEEGLGETEEPATAAEPTRKPNEHVIDKREYCQRCEFFTQPPTVACTNEGTEIVELVDSEQFRVRNCPKVKADEEELQSLVEDEQP